MIITHELPAHAGAIEGLLDGSFGPKRHSKTVYKLRRGIAHLPELSLVAMDDVVDADGAVYSRLVATIRYWPVMIGGSIAAVMLGPIAVDPAYRSAGLGATLIRHSLEQARALGHRIVILVGDAPYYVRFGFTRANAAGLSLPGPVDPDRFLGLELVEGAMQGLTGMVGRAAPARGAAMRTVAARAVPARGAVRPAARPHTAMSADAPVIAASASAGTVIPHPAALPADASAGEALAISVPLDAAAASHAAQGGRRRLRRAAR